MDALRTRIAKLRGMSLAEIAARSSYAVSLAIERRRVAASTATPHVGSLGEWLHMVERRRRQPRPAFFSGLRDREALCALFAANGPYADQAAKARAAAAAARGGTFEFFGQRFHYGSTINWHADPVTGREWPRVFHGDVPIHAGGADIGDVKYVWELNRHQFLIDLGKAYWLFDDIASAAAVYRIVRDWIDENPYGVGVNWSCALEPAFRAWSWLWAYQFCQDDPALDDDTRARWLRGFDEHGRFIHRHLEYYSSPYNHLIGEASALYALGTVFPELPEAPRWRQRARGVLVRRLPTEFHADGGSVEQSTFYHHATLGFYLLATLLGEANGDPFPTHLDEAIERGIEFSMRLMQPDGRLPSIGGADDGKCIRLEHLPFWDFRAFQAVGAARYGRGDFRFAAGDFGEDALWLLGTAGRARFLDAQPDVPDLSMALRASGYYVLRSGWTADSDYLCFDCGEQAAGLRRDDVPSAAHGHADCLSVVLWLAGRPVLVDPGFFCYNGEPDWETHFRRTAAHNTAVVDGLDQSRHVHKMAWMRVFEASAEAWSTRQRGGAAGGSHDGYLRQSGVRHRRAVWLHESGCCLICDQFTGGGPHDVDLNFQFAPGAAALVGERTVLFDAAELTWTSTVCTEARLRCGEPGPDGGWIAPSLGVRMPAARLTIRARLEAPVTTFLTLAIPRVAGDPARTRTAVTSARELVVGAPAADGAVEWFRLPAAAAADARELVSSLTTWRAERPASAPMLEGCC